jgi:hypothetical protein
MSLTSFLDIADVKAKVKLLLPKRPRKISEPIKVEPKSKRYTMVGTAFDYLLRFEIMRRAPHAIGKPWVAEEVPDHIWQKGFYAHLTKDATGVVSFSTHRNDDEELAKQVAERMRNVVEKAKSAYGDYLKIKSPSPIDQANVAAHAIRLAKLDPVIRARVIDSTFETANQEDVEDLVSMLGIVPFDSLIHEKIMLLNPTFGEASELVGGGDTDLITGDTLVDFKTTKSSEMTAVDLNQLFGYYLLARHQSKIDPSFPTINRVAFYFCRHGFIWTMPVSAWTENPQFTETEEWFFNRAKEVFSRVGPTGLHQS